MAPWHARHQSGLDGTTRTLKFERRRGRQGMTPTWADHEPLRGPSGDGPRFSWSGDVLSGGQIPTAERPVSPTQQLLEDIKKTRHRCGAAMLASPAVGRDNILVRRGLGERYSTPRFRFELPTPTDKKVVPPGSFPRPSRGDRAGNHRTRRPVLGIRRLPGAESAAMFPSRAVFDCPTGSRVSKRPAKSIR